MVIVCLGEALIDLVPSAGESPTTAPSLAIQPGGAPLNICIGLSRLGRESLFLGCLSSDAFGQRLAHVLDRTGIERLPAWNVSAPTRLAAIDHSDREAAFRFYGDDPADSKLSKADVDAVLQRPEVSGLYVSSLMLAHDSAREIQQYGIDQASLLKLPIYSDPNPRPQAWSSREEMIRATVYLFERSSLAKMSLDDARALGWADEPGALFEWWKSHFPGELFLTGGAAGCWACIEEALVHVRPPVVEPVDPTGAGDAAFAALIAQTHGSEARSEAQLRFAAAAGAMATLTHGAIAALPTLAEVDAFVSDWKS